jgi:hypothetical protein
MLPVQGIEFPRSILMASLGCLLAATAANQPFTLMAASVGWAALCVQLVVLPFFGKGEKLHQEYSANGRLSAAVSAIEAGRLIPALATMFERAMDARPDRRRQPEIVAILQAVEVIPHLEDAQRAMASMNDVRVAYDILKAKSATLWKLGLFHAVTAPITALIYLFAVPIDERAWIAVYVTAGVWVLTLVMTVIALHRFHKRMDAFTSLLDESLGGQI